jgi:hypothetical protein
MVANLQVFEQKKSAHDLRVGADKKTETKKQHLIPYS